MNTHETLKAARELIAKPENWTRGAYARSALRRRVNIGSEKAVCFCAVGAIKTVCDEDPFVEVPAYKALEDAFGNAPEEFNDCRTHAEVLAGFDRAIASTSEAE